MTRPLSDPLPLRDTSAWPGYVTVEVIPWVFGRATVKPLRYNAAGTRFVLADHALADVYGVTVNGEDAGGWAWSNGADAPGHAVAFLDFATAPDSSDEIVADVQGLSGNPADIISTLYPPAAVQDFAIHCRNAGLELGGVLAEQQTIRAAIQSVCEQVGAVWSAGLSGFAMPFPPSADDPLYAELGALDLQDWTAECSLADVVTKLSVPFDYGYGTGKSRQSLTLTAPAALALHGERTATLALPWVKTARQALATATALLQWRARPLWMLKCSVGVQFRAIQPGGWITLTHPRLPKSGQYVVTDLDPGYGQGKVTITAQAPAGLTPAVQITQQSTAFDDITTVYTLSAGGDTVTLTITDADGKLLLGAQVWMDGKGPVTTDAAAQVRFAATPGRHVLHIEADGQSAIDTEITL